MQTPRPIKSKENCLKGMGAVDQINVKQTFSNRLAVVKGQKEKRTDRKTERQKDEKRKPRFPCCSLTMMKDYVCTGMMSVWGRGLLRT